MELNVLWYHPERMSYGCCAMLNELFDMVNARHMAGFGIDSHEPVPNYKGAVVVFHGGNEAAINRGPALAALMSAELVNYDWVVFISVGDENDEFPLHLIVHRNCRIWSQTVKPGGTNSTIVDRCLIEGYLPDTQRILGSLDPFDRDLDWFFAGQVTHERRKQCVRALEACRKPVPETTFVPGKGSQWFDQKSILIKTQAFGSGLSHETYYDFLSRTKIAPCPSGPVTPDSFRMAEALEAGAVPVLDAHSPNGPLGYWDLVFGKDHPFWVVQDWEKEWPDVKEKILANFEAERRATQFFWKKYKLNLSQWLLRDMILLGAI